MTLVCHVILQNHAIMRFNGHMTSGVETHQGELPSW